MGNYIQWCLWTVSWSQICLHQRLPAIFKIIQSPKYEASFSWHSLCCHLLRKMERCHTMYNLQNPQRLGKSTKDHQNKTTLYWFWCGHAFEATFCYTPVVKLFRWDFWCQQLTSPYQTEKLVFTNSETVHETLFGCYFLWEYWLLKQSNLAGTGCE